MSVRAFRRDPKCWLALLMVAAAFVLLGPSLAIGGGVHIHEGSVRINGAPASQFRKPPRIRLGHETALTFACDSYSYSGAESAYVLFWLSRDHSGNHQGSLFVCRLRSRSIDDELNLHHEVTFLAPKEPGVYRLFYSPSPILTARPDERIDRDLLERFRQHAQSEPLATFEVTIDAESYEKPDLIFTLDGKYPGREPVSSGVRATPLQARWIMRKPPSAAPPLFSYRLLPTDREWSPWSAQNELSIFHLPVGVHAIMVRARYRNEAGGLIETPPAELKFQLFEPLFSKPTKSDGRSQVVLIQPDERGRLEELLRASPRKALLLGISDYKQNGFPMLPEAAIKKDLDQMKSVLELHGFQCTLKRGRVEYRDAWRELSTLLREASENDRIVIYLSCHGFRDPQALTSGYLAVSDTDPKLPEGTAISFMQLRKLIDESRVKHVLLIVDSCFSGLAAVEKSQSGRMAAVALKPGRLVLTAGDHEQAAALVRDGSMSAFTKNLVEGLRGQAEIFPDGYITAGELFLYSQYHTVLDTESKQTPLYGRIGTGVGEFIFEVPTTKAAN
jgi:hypothetical protein